MPLVKTADVELRLKRFYPAGKFTCSKLTIETLEPGVKYVQS